MPVTSEIFKAHKQDAKVFIETGSYVGDGIQAAVEAGFETIYSIEFYDNRVGRCRARFKDVACVKVIQGNSGEALAELLKRINEPILFWLDAHYDAYVPESDNPKILTEPQPVLQELEAIKNHSIKTHTILIDDRRIFIGDSPVWHNTVESQIVDKLKEINPEYEITNIDSACFPKDIILAKITTKGANWLYDWYGRNITSQHGEDGVIEKIFQVIKPLNKVCVEFGAMNGIVWSNTYSLIMNHGWRSVQIEMRDDYFKDLIKTYKDKHVACIKEVVLPTNLERLLTQSNVPQDFDLLSIDVDGIDYELFESIKTFKPQVILLECDLPHENLIKAVALAKTKGYELIAVTGVNAIFVKRDLYPLFEIKNSSVENYKVWTESRQFKFGLELL